MASASSTVAPAPLDCYILCRAPHQLCAQTTSRSLPCNIARRWHQPRQPRNNPAAGYRSPCTLQCQPEAPSSTAPAATPRYGERNHTRSHSRQSTANRSPASAFPQLSNATHLPAGCGVRSSPQHLPPRTLAQSNCRAAPPHNPPYPFARSSSLTNRVANQLRRLHHTERRKRP